MAEQPKRGFPSGFQFEVDPDRIEESLRALSKRVADSFTAGRYTKVRLSFRGKQLGPDIPLAVFLAGEGVALWFTGPLAALLVNIGAKAALDVEFLHEADELVQEGLTAYLDGDTGRAEARYRAALERRPDDPAALYNLGVLLKVLGRDAEAVSTLRKAVMGPEGHPDVTRAAEALERFSGGRKAL